jgi:hypothetical protein
VGLGQDLLAISGNDAGRIIRIDAGQVAQLTDDAPTDCLDHGGDVRVGRGLAWHKPGLETRFGPIEVDPLVEVASYCFLSSRSFCPLSAIGVWRLH